MQRLLVIALIAFLLGAGLTISLSLLGDALGP
jgi:hypothetical protein